MAVEKQVYQIEFKGTQKAKVDIKDLKGNIVATSVAVKELRKEVGNFSIDSNKMVQSVKITSGSLDKLQNSVRGARDVSGSATSSVLEMGRAISDSNYGIRGMANNLSQLASNLVYTAKAAGGIGGAFTQIKRALMGPLGIIIAFQTVIALLERMAMKTGDLASEMGKFASESITENVAKLSMLKQALNDSNVSMEDKVDLLSKASTEFKELNGHTLDNADSVNILNQQLTTMIDRMKEVAWAKAVLEAAQDEMKNAAKMMIDGADGMFDSLDGFINHATDSVIKGSNRVATEHAKSIMDARDKVDKYYKMLLGPQKDGKGILLEHLFGKDPKKDVSRRIRELRIGLFDLSKFIVAQNKKAATIMIQDEVEKLRIQQKYELESLKATKDNYIKKAELKYYQFIKESTNEEANLRALATLNKAYKDSGLEYEKGVDALKDKHIQETLAFRLKMHEKYQSEKNKSELKFAKGVSSGSADFGTTQAGSLNNPLSNAGAENLDEYQASLREQFEVEDRLFEERFTNKSIELFNNGIKGIQADLILGNMRLEQQQVLADRELEIEKQKIEAMKNVNSEYVSWISGVGTIMKNIAGDNETLAKAALILEKGSAIADIVIKTSAANQVILATSAARATAGDPSAMATGAARIAKNKVGAGISIASILSTTLSAKNQSVGGTSGGTASPVSQNREFDFNLVGSTRQDQLAAGIANQQQEPIQAYVVASQITSAQQLDNTIQSNASIG